MQWVCNISVFLVISGIVLELIADTKYYKFARWVAGIILLLQFLKPFTATEEMKEQFMAMFGSFSYALDTERILEEIYEADEQAETSVLKEYKESIMLQTDRVLRKNGLKLVQAELSVENDGTIKYLKVWSEYLDGTERGEIQIPLVAPVQIGEETKKETVSPLELYIRDTLAKFYQIEEKSVEVIIREAE